MKTETLKEEIAAEMPVADLRGEIAQLNEIGPLAQQGTFDIYMASADAIPNILLEIGRLREVTYRTVGVGVGAARDLDYRDAFYSHLFLWDRVKERLAGGYRLARTDKVFAEQGVEGLYTSTLCEYEKVFVDYLDPALELGRSWVLPDYQRSLHALLGLWKGIGAFVVQNPRYHKLFGAVSISDDYSRISQNMIVRYLRRTKMNNEWSSAMRALHPFKDQPEELSASLASIEEVSAQVAMTEPDGKGVPVLLRQYFKLNATLLDFVYDPQFQHALDAMVLVDLREAPRVFLERYMGKEGYATFQSEVGKC